MSIDTAIVSRDYSSQIGRGLTDRINEPDPNKITHSLPQLVDRLVAELIF